MDKSNFQFINPQLKSIEYQLNENFVPEKYNNKIPLSFEIESTQNEIKPFATVVLHVKIGDLGDEMPFYSKVIMSSTFKWTDGYDKKIIDILLEQNAPALIYSYMRPIVAYLTMQSGIKPYHLPFMDFTRDK